MRALGLYAHMWWDAPESDEDEQDEAVCPPELLTAGWWTASADLDDDDL